MKLRHYDIDGSVRFVTFCTHHRVPVFTNDLYREVFVEDLRDWLARNQIRLLAWVLMPEHVHLVLMPQEGSRLGLLIGELKLKTSKSIHDTLISAQSELSKRLISVRDGQPRFTLWQRRCYDHNCRDEKSVWEKVGYCHGNPVRRGLVLSPADWQWSSFRSYQGMTDSPIEISL